MRIIQEEGCQLLSQAVNVHRLLANLAQSMLKSVVKAVAISWLINNSGTVQQDIVASPSFRMGWRAATVVFQGVLVILPVLAKVGTVASSMAFTAPIARRRHRRCIALYVGVVVIGVTRLLVRRRRRAVSILNYRLRAGDGRRL